jgi:hypothetical protein
MRTENLLPKFGGKNNPFAQSGAGAAAPPAQNAQPEVEMSRQPELPKTTPLTEKIEEKPAPVPMFFDPKQAFASLLIAPAAMARAVKRLVPTKVAQPETAPVPLPEHAASNPFSGTAIARRSWIPKIQFGWLRYLNPLALWHWVKPFGGGTSPRLTRPAVQGELRLDNVRVVRNDLSQADLDVVPVRVVTNTLQKPATAMKPVTVLKPAPLPVPVAAGGAVAVNLDEPTAWDRVAARFLAVRETQTR